LRTSALECPTPAMSFAVTKSSKVIAEVILNKWDEPNAID
jgi:hypothetical protein